MKVCFGFCLNRIRPLCLQLGFIFTLLLGLISCRPTPPTTTPPVLPPHSPQPKILAPSAHFPPWFWDQLKNKTGTSWNVETYTHDEEALQKISTNKFTVIACTDGLLAQLHARDQLSPLPTPLLEKQDTVLPQYLHHTFDPDNRYGLPYACTLAALRTPEIITTTNITELLSPVSLKNYSLASSPDLLHAFWTQIQGRKNNRPMPETKIDGAIQIDWVENLLKTNLPHTKIILPQSGTFLRLYHLTSGKEANETLLTQFITELWQPKILARLAEENHWTLVHKKALPFTPPDYQKNPLLNPADAVLDRSLFLRPPPISPALE